MKQVIYTSMKNLVYISSILLFLASCKEKKAEYNHVNKKENIKFEYIYKSGDEEISVAINKPPQRAALFSPSTTEILLALGLEDRMVIGTTEGDVLPELKKAYEKVPNRFIGHSFKMTKEAFLLTQPDFVSGYPTDIRDDTTGTPQELIKNGIYPFNMSSMTTPNATLLNVFDDIKMLGKIFDVEKKANKLVSDMEEKLKNAHLKTSEKKTKAMVMASISNGIWIYGSLATDLINRANGVNIYKDVSNQYELVSYESILERNPDVIFMADIVSRKVSIEEKKEILKNDPILREISAVKNNRIYQISDQDISPGVRNVDFIIKMNKIFYGD